MSLDQINDYGLGNCNLSSLMETIDRQRRGFMAVSLTHYDDNLEPKIAAGSIVELGGALLKCEADESITGWAGIGNDNDVYIKLVPSGTTATAAFTTAAPTWSTSKQGWYVGNDRYIGGLYKDAGGNYTRKWLYPPGHRSLFNPLLHVEDQKSAGTDGGTFTSGSWQTRVLNIEVVNTIEGASLSSNQITLPAGVYEIEASAPAYLVTHHKIKLRNISDSSDALIGTQAYCIGTDSVQTVSFLRGRITITASKTFELQHRCSITQASVGLGMSSGYDVVEIYADVWIKKIK